MYRHADLDHVADARWPTRGPTVVVTDTVFSMDGDAAPRRRAGRGCAGAHGALLVLDEAHAVLGPVPDLAGVRACSASARCRRRSGSLGGFVAGSHRFVDLLVNRARPFIFTTAPTPADTAAALAALRIVRDAEGDGLVARLRGHVERLRPGHPSPIVPVVLGDEAPALAAAAALAARGSARARHPAADGAPGDVAAAGQPLGRPHRRAGRPP